jgi:CheY-like chemotaxis protein
MMPEMDGFAVCRWLRANESFKDVPVVLLTGVSSHIYDTRYPMDGVLKSDSDEYLEKPLKPEVLLETVEKMTRK